MSRATILCIFYALISVTITGCYTLTEVNFGNKTTASIKLKTTHTGQEIEVPPGKFEKLPHTVGDLIVTTKTNGQFRFSEVAPLDLDDNYIAKHESFFGPGYVTLTLVLETNMQLYVLKPGEKALDKNVQQPNGYPKAGKK